MNTTKIKISENLIPALINNDLMTLDADDRVQISTLIQNFKNTLPENYWLEVDELLSYDFCEILNIETVCADVYIMSEEE